MTSRALFHTLSSKLPRFDWAHESVDSPSALLSYFEDHDPAFKPQHSQPGQMQRLEREQRNDREDDRQDDPDAAQLERDIQADKLRKLKAAQSNEDIRTFVTHLCALSSLSLYNAVLALTQKPTATTALSPSKWHELGFGTKIGAQGIVVAHPKGPTSYAYDIEDVEPLNSRRLTAEQADPYTAVANNRERFSQCVLDPIRVASQINDKLGELGLRTSISYPALRSSKESTFPVLVTPLSFTPSDSQPLKKSPRYGVEWPPLYRIEFPTVVPNEVVFGKIDAGSAEDPLDRPMFAWIDWADPRNTALRLLYTLFGVALATTAYNAPWMQSKDDEYRRRRAEDLFHKASDRLNGYIPITTAEFEAAMAVYIVVRRFSWDFSVPIAEDFIADDAVLPPVGASFFSVLQAAHYLEKLILNKGTYKPHLISLFSKRRDTSIGDAAG